MDPAVHRQLTLLLTSPRVAPGLLSASAWEALRGAGAVLAADPEAPVARAIAAAGVDVIPPPAGALTSPQSLAQDLLGRAADGPVVWVGSPDGDPGLAEALAVALPDEDPPTLELLVGSWDVPGARLLDAVAVMDRLRSPGGCPWDAEQTHASLTPYLVEEAHEAVEVLERIDAVGEDEEDDAGEDGGRAALRREAVDELGDVLLQVLFHARVAAEDEHDPFDVDDVAAGLVAKLVRRHPHVFAGAQVDDAADVEASWDQIKAQELRGRPGREGPLDGIPAGMPPLARAAKVAARLERAGRSDWGIAWAREQEGAGDPGARLLRVVLDLRAGDMDADAALRHTLRALGDDARG